MASIVALYQLPQIIDITVALPRYLMEAGGGEGISPSRYGGAQVAKRPPKGAVSPWRKVLNEI
jgi:hypothetical protein